jgi:DNA-binding response OmpR family regulator
MQIGQAKGGRVLVCEDNLLIADGWSSMLREAGYDIVGPASSAETALEEAQRQLPDVALIDIGLRGPIDGVSVATELAQLGVLVIFVTADYQRAAAAREHAADILIKPVRYPILIGAVTAAINSSGKVH